MNDQDLDSAENQIATEETEHNVEQQNTPQIDSEAVKKAEEQEKNWRAMRQRQKELELEIQRRDELLDRVLKTQAPQAPQPVVEAEEPDEEFIPAGKVKGIAKRMQQPLEKKVQELEAKLAQQEQQKLIQNLRTQYSDFDDVVNVETLEMLEKQEPELAATIAQFKDPYKMGLHSYKYIKALNLAEKVPEARHKKETIQKLEKNAKAVQSPQAYEKRPMAQAVRAVQSREEQNKLYEEMMGYASKATGF